MKNIHGATSTFLPMGFSLRYPGFTTYDEIVYVFDHMPPRKADGTAVARTVYNTRRTVTCE